MISRRLSGCRQSSPQARNTFEINQARDCPTRGHCRKRVDAAQIEGSPREINIAHRTRTGAAAARLAAQIGDHVAENAEQANAMTATWRRWKEILAAII